MPWPYPCRKIQLSACWKGICEGIRDLRSHSPLVPEKSPVSPVHSPPLLGSTIPKLPCPGWVMMSTECSFGIALKI